MPIYFCICGRNPLGLPMISTTMFLVTSLPSCNANNLHCFFGLSGDMRKRLSKAPRHHILDHVSIRYCLDVNGIQAGALKWASIQLNIYHF
jgi:hypothetical protein